MTRQTARADASPFTRAWKAWISRGHPNLDLLLYAILVALTWAANHSAAPWRLVFWAACLGLPLLDGCDLGACLAWRRRGWGIALALILGGAAAAYAGSLSLALLGHSTGILHPPAGSLRFLGRQALIWAPLAFAEEVFFRGYLQEQAGARRWSTRRWGPLAIRVWVAAALFGLAHLLARPATGAWTVLGSGLVLGWVTERSEGSIWPAVLLHTAGNLALAWFAIVSP